MTETNNSIQAFLQSVEGYDQKNESALSVIIDQLGGISSQLTTSDALAINDLVLMLQDNLLFVQEENRQLNDAELTLLKEWPETLQSYFKDSNSSQAFASLLNNLCNQNWPVPLSEDDRELLQEMMPSPEQDKGTFSFTPIYQEIFDLLLKINAGENKQLDKIHLKLNELISLPEIEEEAGFYDLCIFTQENIELLLKNDFPSSQPQRTLLTAWLNLSFKYLTTKNNSTIAASLIRNLLDPNWPAPLSREDASAMSSLLHIEHKLVFGEDNKIVRASIKQCCYKLHSLILAFNENNERGNEINHSINELVSLLKTENKPGPVQVCFVFQNSFNNTIGMSGLLDYNQSTDFATFPFLLSSFVYEPDVFEYREKLLAYFQNHQWLGVITNDDYELVEKSLSDAPDTEIDRDELDHYPEEFPEQEINPVFDMPAMPQAINMELIEMLIYELQSMLDDSFSIIPDMTDPDNRDISALENYQLRMERFASACQAAELTGIYQTCMLFDKNISGFIRKKSIFEIEHANLLYNWILLLKSYLENLGSQQFSDEIVNFLTFNNWLYPVLDEIRPALTDLLNAAYPIEQQFGNSDRKTEISGEDISIELTEEINKDLLDGLLQELPDQTAEFSNYMQMLYENTGGLEVLDKAQRIAHTIKGAANTVGIKGVALITHQLEDILHFLTANQTLPPKILSNSLLSASDCLQEMCDCLIQRRPGPDYARDISIEILGWITRLETEGLDALNNMAESSSVLNTESRAQETEKADTPEESKEENRPESFIQLPTSVIDNMLRLVGETMILNLQLQDKITNSSLMTNNFKEHSTSLKNLTNELERYIEISGNSLSSNKAVNQDSTFDSLEFEEYNELHTASHRIVESASDAHEINLDIETNLKDINELLIEQSRIQKQIQDSVMRSRMIPVSSVIPRLERAIRQTCRATNKLVKLYPSGEDTLVDSTILNEMIDPLMHMLRNSIDHGIEFPDERIKKDKEEIGRIDLNFSSEGTHVVIKFKDDGAGFNKEKIIRVAKEKGLIETDKSMTESEIYHMILQPGFTTQENTTLTSGRGIGMDIVYSQILALNGSLEMQSKQDKGVEFELRLPANLMTSHAIFTHLHDQLIAISSNGITQILHAEDGQLTKTADGFQYKFNKEILPVYTLDSLLGTGIKDDSIYEDSFSALLVRQENSNHIVLVREIFDSRNIVIKKTGRFIQKIQGILGATISGDGSVVPVLEIPELIRTAQSSRTRSQVISSHANISKIIPTVLIVDDSISARRAVAQIVKDAGYQIQTAKDGLEAIGLVEKFNPAIALVDFEMPRMNGIEFTSHIRGSQYINQLPIIMITSRTTDKHRELAFNAGVNEYLNKPFSEDLLLDRVRELIGDLSNTL